MILACFQQAGTLSRQRSRRNITLRRWARTFLLFRNRRNIPNWSVPSEGPKYIKRRLTSLDLNAKVLRLGCQSADVMHSIGMIGCQLLSRVLALPDFFNINNYNNIIIIIYHDFLPTPGGVVMSSQVKHTHSHQDTPLSPYT